MNTRALGLIRLAWTLATVALAAFWRPEALVLLVGLAFLAPVVREVAPAADRDERQRFEDYRASHVALIAVFVLLFFAMAKALFVDGDGVPGDLLLMLVTALVVRVGVSLARGVGPRRAGLVLGFVTGGAWLSFSIASHGLSSEAAIGGALAVASGLGVRWPATGGLLLVAAASMYLIGFVWPAVTRGVLGPGGDVRGDAGRAGTGRRLAPLAVIEAWSGVVGRRIRRPQGSCRGCHRASPMRRRRVAGRSES